MGVVRRAARQHVLSRKRRYIVKYRQQERKRLREFTGDYSDKWVEDTLTWNIHIWLDDRAKTSFTNKRWRRAIRASRDWSWLDQNGMDLFSGSRRQNGHHYILCIFHDERTPSLWLHRDGGYHCFGCLASGNIVDLAIHLHDLKTVREVRKFFKLDTATPKQPMAHPQQSFEQGRQF